MQPDLVGLVDIDVRVPKISGFLNASAGIVEEHQERPIAQCHVAVCREGSKERVDLIAFQVDRSGRLGAFGRYGFHSLSFGQHFGVMDSEVTIERAQRGKPLISSTRLVSALFLNRTQEIQHAFKDKIVEAQTRDRAAAQSGNMHQQQFNGVAVAPDRTWAEAFLDLQVVFRKTRKRPARGCRSSIASRGGEGTKTSISLPQ